MAARRADRQIDRQTDRQTFWETAYPFSPVRFKTDGCCLRILQAVRVGTKEETETDAMDNGKDQDNDEEEKETASNEAMK